MRSKAGSSISIDIKNILKSLKRIENKIGECCPSCIDFTTQMVGKLPFNLTTQKVENNAHKYKLTLGNYKLQLDYPVTDPDGLDIEPISNSSNENGIAIPQKLFVDIKPACKRVTVDIAKSTPNLFSLMVFGNGKELQTLTPPVKDTEHYTLNVDIGRKVDRLYFGTGHKEVYVKKICCYN